MVLAEEDLSYIIYENLFQLTYLKHWKTSKFESRNDRLIFFSTPSFTIMYFFLV